MLYSEKCNGQSGTSRGVQHLRDSSKISASLKIPQGTFPLIGMFFPVDQISTGRVWFFILKLSYLFSLNNVIDVFEEKIRKIKMSKKYS